MMSEGFDLQDYGFGGSDACAVSLASLKIEGRRIAEAAVKHVRACFPEEASSPDVQLQGEVRPVVVAAGGAEPELRASIAGSGAPVGSVRVNVEIVRDGKLLERVPVGLQVRVHNVVAVAAESIPAGERLSERNVTFLRRDVTRVHDVCLNDETQIADKVAARTIRPGQLITRRLVGDREAPVVIEANQRVILVARGHGLRIVTLGKAVRSARKGEVAKARNLRTGREVVGVAVEEGTIEVHLGGSNEE
jgi:flagella basal body P-ring formation protein FlgA